MIDAEGNECGPYTAEQLQVYAADGTISPTTQVWTEGLETWISALEVEGLFPVGVRRPQLLTGPAMPAGRPHPGLPEGASAITVSQPPSGLSTLIIVAVSILLLGAYFAFKLSAPDAVAVHNSPETVPESEVVPAPEGKPELDAMISTLDYIETHLTIIFIIFGGVATVCFLLYFFLFHSRCPKCKKRNALNLTGREGKEEHSFTGSTLKGSAEWTCRFCGHTFWRTYSRNNPHSH